MRGNARLEVSSGDQALAELDAAVLLADADLRLHLHLLDDLLDLDALEAVERASRLLLGAVFDVERGHEALSVVDAAVLLAHANISLHLEVASHLNTLEAVEGAARL